MIAFSKCRFVSVITTYYNDHAVTIIPQRRIYILDFSSDKFYGNDENRIYRVTNVFPGFGFYGGRCFQTISLQFCDRHRMVRPLNSTMV